MIARRLAKLETARKKKDRGYVIYVQDGGTKEEALARFFEPYEGETWPVMIAPERCRTVEEWLERYAPKHIENRAT